MKASSSHFTEEISQRSVYFLIIYVSTGENGCALLLNFRDNLQCLSCGKDGFTCVDRKSCLVEQDQGVREKRDIHDFNKRENFHLFLAALLLY